MAREQKTPAKPSKNRSLQQLTFECRGALRNIGVRVRVGEQLHIRPRRAYHVRSWPRGVPATRAAAQPGKFLKTSFGDRVKHTRETERKNLAHKWSRPRQQPCPDISPLLHKRSQGHNIVQSVREGVLEVDADPPCQRRTRWLARSASVEKETGSGRWRRPHASTNTPAEGTSQSTESLFLAGVCAQRHAKNPSWHNSPEMSSKHCQRGTKRCLPIAMNRLWTTRWASRLHLRTDMFPTAMNRLRTTTRASWLYLRTNMFSHTQCLRSRIQVSAGTSRESCSRMEQRNVEIVSCGRLQDGGNCGLQVS